MSEINFTVSSTDCADAPAGHQARKNNPAAASMRRPNGIMRPQIRIK
jgi:hypothetical protein